MARNLTPIGPRGVAVLRGLVLASLVVSVVVTAVLTRHWRMVNDGAQLSYAVFMVEHGFAPYRQLFEMNMPGIYLVNWTVMHALGGGDAGWHLFDWLLMAGLTGGMVVAVGRGQRAAGIFGGLLFTLFHARDGAGQMGQRDLIIAVLSVWAVACVFEALRQRRIPLAWMFGFGLLMGAAVTIKPTPAPFAVAVLGLALWRWHQQDGAGGWISPLLAAVAGALIPLTLVAAWLQHFHSIAAFGYILRVVLPYYRPLAQIHVVELGVRAFSPSLRWLLLLAAVVALRMRRTWCDWEYGIVLVGVMFGIASYYLQHKGFNYHRYPMLAFLFLWAGMVLMRGLSERARPLTQYIAAASLLFASVIAPIYARQTRTSHWPEDFTTSLTADLDQLGGQQLDGRVQCLYTMAECNTTLYRMRLVQATGLMYDFFLFQPDAPVVRDARARFWSDIHRQPPEVIVLGRGAFPFGPRDFDKLQAWPELVRFLDENYVVYDTRFFAPSEGGPLGYRLYVLRSALRGGAPQDSQSQVAFASKPASKWE